MSSSDRSERARCDEVAKLLAKQFAGSFQAELKRLIIELQNVRVDQKAGKISMIKKLERITDIQRRYYAKKDLLMSLMHENKVCIEKFGLKDEKKQTYNEMIDTEIQTVFKVIEALFPKSSDTPVGAAAPVATYGRTFESRKAKRAREERERAEAAAEAVRAAAERRDLLKNAAEAERLRLLMEEKIEQERPYLEAQRAYHREKRDQLRKKSSLTHISL